MPLDWARAAAAVAVAGAAAETGAGAVAGVVAGGGGPAARVWIDLKALLADRILPVKDSKDFFTLEQAWA